MSERTSEHIKECATQGRLPVSRRRSALRFSQFTDINPTGLHLLGYQRAGGVRPFLHRRSSQRRGHRRSNRPRTRGGARVHRTPGLFEDRRVDFPEQVSTLLKGSGTLESTPILPEVR